MTMENTLEPRELSGIFRVERDSHGFATAIAMDDVILVHLNPGTSRNEDTIDDIVATLNGSRFEWSIFDAIIGRKKASVNLTKDGKCKYCGKPKATNEDYMNIPEGEGTHLCWSAWGSACVCIEEAFDRVLRENEKLKAGLK